MNTGLDVEYIVKIIPSLLEALPVTLTIAGSALVIGFIFGLLICAAKLSGNKLLAGLANGYTRLVRSVPTVIMLFLLFYGLPELLLLIHIDITDWDKISIGIVCFSIFNAAYFSENMRSAYEAVDKGQHEAAASVGLTTFQALYRIIFPQAFVVALPNFGNTIILSLKDTSVIFTLGVIDLLGKAKLISSNGFGIHKVEVFIAVALLYWLIIFMIEKLVALLEHVYSKSKRTA